MMVDNVNVSIDDIFWNKNEKKDELETSMPKNKNKYRNYF